MKVKLKLLEIKLFRLVVVDNKFDLPFVCINNSLNFSSLQEETERWSGSDVMRVYIRWAIIADYGHKKAVWMACG